MSDTPRVDSVETMTSDDRRGYLRGYVPADFARQLERELADKTAECEELKNDSEQLDYLLSADSGTQAQICYAGNGSDRRIELSKAKIDRFRTFDAAIGAGKK